MEETLDPGDWEAFRRLGHRMIDDLVGHLSSLRERPVWSSPPAAVRARLDEPLPVEPQGAERAYRDFLECVLPYPTGNLHPHFWGWVMGTGTPLMALAEMWAAALNCNVSGFDDAASLVEDRVLAWCREMLGLPAGGGGLLVSGGSMANLVGLAAARRARAEAGAGAPRPLTLYASSETHNSVRKAVQLLGLGADALRSIPVDAAYEVDVAALARAVAEDRAAGRQPFCVVGNAGTVNTGAIDDLQALAELCGREGLWLHVDGAFGAFAALAPGLRPRLRGMERADSVAFDLHKWAYVPYEAGCVLMRDEAAQRAAFAVGADYLAVAEGGIAARGRRFADCGPQLSRGFRALKIWMGLKEQGVAKLGRLVQQNLAQAAHLAACIRRQPRLELLAPVPLNVVCFRYVGDGRPGLDLDALNRRLLARLHDDGVAAPSYTMLGGVYALRAAITNHRSRTSDFDRLVAAVVRLGDEETREATAAAAGREA